MQRNLPRWLAGLGLFLLLALPLLGESQGATEEQQFFEAKCGQCHPSSRIFLLNLTSEQRRHVVRRMRDRWEGGSYWLSDDDLERILAYIEDRADDTAVVRSEVAGGPKDLFRERCAGCHELDRVYARVKLERENPAAWLHVVTRMRAKAPDWIEEQEANRIIKYLRSLATPKSKPATQ